MRNNAAELEALCKLWNASVRHFSCLKNSSHWKLKAIHGVHSDCFRTFSAIPENSWTPLYHLILGFWWACAPFGNACQQTNLEVPKNGIIYKFRTARKVLVSWLLDFLKICQRMIWTSCSIQAVFYVKFIFRDETFERFVTIFLKRLLRDFLT